MSHSSYIKETALEAKENAQRIAFAPVVFQSALSLRNLGILQIIEDNRNSGISLNNISSRLNLPIYGVRVLLESGLNIGLVTESEDNYHLTKTGYFILHDELTRVNMDFINDVCYLGLFELEKSITTGKPEGLKVFGSYKTIYEGLSELPADVQKSWFAFDHFYSDNALPKALEAVFSNSPKTILDIGGNTGKFALACTKHSQYATITILDLPGQIQMAKKSLQDQLGFDRIDFHCSNILDESQEFPKGYDAIWMSQFLDCFSESEITSILRRCSASLNMNGSIFILEPFWNRQRFESASFCLSQTSLYFTTMANGNSQMYHSDVFIKCIEKAGLRVEEMRDGIGLSHSLIQIKAK